MDARKRNYPDEIKTAARSLYLRKFTIPEIAEELAVPKRTLYSWQEQGSWQSFLRQEAVEESIQRRLTLLAERDDKSDRDLNEMDRLIKQLNQMAKFRQFEIGNAKLIVDHPESEAVQSVQKKISGAPAVVRNASHGKNKKGKIKNDVSFLTLKDFQQKWMPRWYKGQQEMYDASNQRNRFILKSRQIGFTWYCSQEAFIRACTTGTEQIFLSATRRQSDVFKKYVTKLVAEDFDIELKGSPLILNTEHGKAGMHFLSNNSMSAQSESGHVYIDEAFWIRKFSELYKVATAMATHKHFTRTVFSTPSAVNHEAYPLWTGEEFNKRFKRKRVEFPCFKELQSGVLCPDSHWRKIITLDDAIAGGFDRIDRDQLKLEYSPESFKQLYLCEFIDDTMGVFKLSLLQACGVDTETWGDFDAKASRPLGNLPVAGGYDPARHQDDATFVIVAMPMSPGDKHRVIKKIHWRDKSFTFQAKEIEKLTKQYNFQHIGIDTTGPGLGVFDIVKDFYHRATPIHYSVGSKTELVQKTKSVIESGRLEFDEEWTDLVHAFLTIRQTSTNGGGMTYSAGRTATTGHADSAWALMHALIHEPLNTDRNTKSCVAFGD